MHRLARTLFPLTLLALTFSAVPTAAADTRAPHAGMLRNPDVSATHIVFRYAGDLWTVPREGGVASPLAAPAGNEGFPRFSADGESVAFMANYDGNTDIYIVPTAGGEPFRVTHHPSGEILCDWTPDGRLLFFAGNYTDLGIGSKLYTVAADGGLPEQLPVPYGTFGAISPDGEWLAYTPYTRDFSTWKRYRGGLAADIWLFNLQTHESQKITDWEGTDSQPMWHGDKLYYMSDAGPSHRLNIWSYDTRSGSREQITKFDEWDVKWPAMGPGPDDQGEIVFQNGADLYLLDLGTEMSRTVSVQVPGDRTKVRKQRFDVSSKRQGVGIGATGKRITAALRGDIWTLPAEKGIPRNLTRTDGVAERNPTWSPDGRWIAYFSDETGEYELYIRQSDGKGETRQLTKHNVGYLLQLVWSPDSEMIAFTDKAGGLFVYTLESDSAVQVMIDPYGSQPMFSWSHDANWIAYIERGNNYLASIWLYKVPTAEKHQVTSGMFYDTWPTFDRKGEYLYFASNRRFASPQYEDIGSTFIYTDTDQLVVVPLRDDIASPWAPKTDEETWEEEEEEDEEEKPEENGDDSADEESDESKPEDEEDGEEPAEPEGDDAEAEDEADGDEEEEEEEEILEIDIEGFEQRAMLLPVKSGAFVNLAVNDSGQLLYVRAGRNGGAIKLFDITDDEKEEKDVLSGVFWFDMSSDGKKLLVGQGPRLAIVSAKPGQNMKKTIKMNGLTATIDPRAEWRQVFLEAWRLQRDFFYVANLHGVDWEAVRDQYIQMIDDCTSRSDVSYVISEMISELNIGHAYYFGGEDTEDTPSVSVGLLGCDFELHEGAYRIKKIHTGGVWDLDARGPLSQPGVYARAGDYVLAVNDIPLDTSKDPWAAFQGLAGDVVMLTVSDVPYIQDEDEEEAEEDEDAEEEASDEENSEDEEEEEKDPYEGQRDVLVKLMGSDGGLRYRAWVEHNRAHVDEKSDGQVGYIHVPDTGINGQNELFRQFFGQRHKAALIIDERWNGGGQMPDRFIELLNRPATNYWAQRHGTDQRHPADSHQGPKCMLINGAAGSGGDAFPYLFRQKGLGPLIGMRTWGGLVGISGNPGLIDGGYTTVPQSGFYEIDGTWGVEGHGVDPDIEVVDDPALMVDGGDPQLDKAIEVMLAEIQRNRYVPPGRPADPERAGMGIRERDK